MIEISVLKPKTGLMPRSHRQINTALATALNRAGNFKAKEACAWRGTPDVAIFKCDPVNIELRRHVNTDLAGKIAEEFSKKRWDGITITLNGELGKAKLEVDIDIYANEYAPLRARITNEKLEVPTEPRGSRRMHRHRGGHGQESLYPHARIKRRRHRADWRNNTRNTRTRSRPNHRKTKGSHNTPTLRQ